MHHLERGEEVPDGRARYLTVVRSLPRHGCWVTGHIVAGLDGTASVDGRAWLGELVAADRLDELCLTISPVMGSDPLPVSVTPSGAGLARFELKGAMAEDHTVFLRYETQPQAGD